MAAGIPFTSSAAMYFPEAGTDGDTYPNSGVGTSGEFAYTAVGGNQYVQLDLGATYSVDKIKAWHYFVDGRSYHGVKLQVSANGSTWTTIYDSAVQGEYAETSAGKTHTFSAQNVRYVREYLNGSTINAEDHWVEMEVFGSRTNVMIGDYFEWNENSGTMVKYYYAGSERIAMREGTGAGTVGLKWLLGDHLGSTSISAQGSDGAKQSELRYKPFGELRYAWGTTTTSLRYTGQRAEGTGLYDYGARFMDPLLGRFIQPDPIVPGTGEGGNSNAVGSLGASTYSPLTVDYHEHQFLEHLNSDNKASLQDTNFRLPPVPTNSIAFDRYAYSLNNPIRYVDPSGHFAILGVLPFIPVWGWVALGAVALAGVVYYAAGGPEALANGIYQAGEAASNSVNVLLAESANDQTDTTKPGPYAGESIDARGPDRDFTDEEREAIDAIGRATGCHTCGSKSPRTKSGHFIPDHQPPSALNPSGSPQRLYPHCLSCSRRQGGQTRDVLRR